jgi:hypothetical protein
MRTKLIECKLYLEGVEVLFNSVNITERVGQPPNASISFPADSKVMYILPKTVCHLFYYDEGIPYKEIEKEAKKADWRLIFQGELVGNGITFNDSRREIQLQFSGFTYNFHTNKLLSFETGIPSLVNSSVFCINYPDEKDEKALWAQYQFTINSLTGIQSPLQQLSATLSDADAKFDDVVRLFLKAIIEQGPYLNALSRAFGILSQIYIYDSRIVRKILHNVAAARQIIDKVKSLSATQSIMSVLQETISSFAYDYVELAAPAMISSDKVGGLRRIFIKPYTSSFPVLKCNLVFNDEVNRLSFSRSYDNEPTRLMKLSQPLDMRNYSSTSNDLDVVSLAIVAPHNIIVGNEVDKRKKGDSTTDNNVLGLTQEEQCRGVVVDQTIDQTGIENSYLMAVLSKVVEGGDKLSYDELYSKMVEQGLANKASAGFKEAFSGDPTPEIKNLHTYHMALASIDLSESRTRERSMLVNVPYSPYRTIGFPGIVMTKYFYSMVGVLNSINTYISADGNATQDLQYSHTRVYYPTSSGITFEGDELVFNPSKSFSFMDDSINRTNFWFDDFIYADFYDHLSEGGTVRIENDLRPNGIQSFYKELTDRNDASLYGVFDDFRKSLDKVKNNYNSNLARGTGQRFINETTWRHIPSKSDVQNYLVSGLRNLDTTQVTVIEPRPFVRERRVRVEDVFDDKPSYLIGEIDAPPEDVVNYKSISPSKQVADVVSSYDSMITSAMQKNGLPISMLPYLKAMITQESQGNPFATSDAGAKGLMQLIPGTASDMGIDPAERTIPEKNIAAGVKYFAKLYNQFGNIPLAAAAYNAGPGAVEKSGRHIPPYEETQTYVKKVMGYAKHYNETKV